MTVPKRDKAARACIAEGCVAPALSHKQVTDKLGKGAVTGLCTLHTLRAMVRVKSSSLPPVVGEYHDATPYRDWVRSITGAGGIAYKDLAVHDVSYAQLSEITGVHRVTFSKLRNGHVRKVRRPVVEKLKPFVLLTEGVTQWGIEVGGVYVEAQARYAPLLTVVVDTYKRAWQLRGEVDSPRWSPAHTVDTRPSRQEGRPHAPRVDVPEWPVQVVWLPPVMQMSTTR